MVLAKNKINIGIDHILIFNESIARIKLQQKKSLIARFATTSNSKI